MDFNELNSKWQQKKMPSTLDTAILTQVINFEDYLETHDADGNGVSVGAANSMGNGIANDNFRQCGTITPLAWHQIKDTAGYNR